MDGEEAVYRIADRSGLIIGLSVSAIILLGPLAGIPAWIIANQDLRDLHAGLISPSATRSLTVGRILAILGTFFSPLWLLIAFMTLWTVVLVLGEMTMR